MTALLDTVVTVRLVLWCWLGIQAAKFTWRFVGKIFDFVLTTFLAELILRVNKRRAEGKRV